MLREFEHEDWRAVLAYQSDPRYLRHYAWSQRDEAAVREFVGRFVAGQADEPLAADINICSESDAP